MNIVEKLLNTSNEAMNYKKKALFHSQRLSEIFGEDVEIEIEEIPYRQAGKTTLLKQIANSIERSHPEIEEVTSPVTKTRTGVWTLKIFDFEYDYTIRSEIRSIGKDETICSLRWS